MIFEFKLETRGCVLIDSSRFVLPNFNRILRKKPSRAQQHPNQEQSGSHRWGHSRLWGGGHKRISGACRNVSEIAGISGEKQFDAENRRRGLDKNETTVAGAILGLWNQFSKKFGDIGCGR